MKATRTLLLLAACLLLSTSCTTKKPAASEEGSDTNGSSEVAAPTGNTNSTKEGEGSGVKGDPSAKGANDETKVGLDKPANAKTEPERGVVLPLEQSEGFENREMLSENPLTVAEFKTTSCSIFIPTTEGQVAELEKLVKKSPSATKLRLALAQRMYMVGQVKGDLDQILKAAEVALRLDTDKNPGADELMIAASAMGSLHRNAEARELAERALKLDDTKAQDVAYLLAGLDWEAGKYDESLPILQKAVTVKKGLYGYARSAQTLASQGEYELADTMFSRGERSYAGTAPIPQSWINVQRGIMHMHAGDFPRAKTYFQAAYDRCPNYPMAVEHLAEIHSLMGDPKRADELYAETMKLTDNPEFMAARADVLDELGKAAEAKELREKAHVSNKALLERHPDAMYWHAADFFLGSEAKEDKELGLKLLQKNAEARPNALSFQALAAAQLELNDVEGARKSIERSLATPIKTAEIFYTAAHVASAEGKADEAAKHAEAARALNPKIEEMEGPLPKK